MYPKSSSTMVLKTIYLEGKKLDTEEIFKLTKIKRNSIAGITDYCVGKGLLKKESLNGKVYYWIPESQKGEVRRKLIRMGVIKNNEI